MKKTLSSPRRAYSQSQLNKMIEKTAKIITHMDDGSQTMNDAGRAQLKLLAEVINKEYGVLPKTVVCVYNSSKTDFSVFYRLYFRVKRGVKSTTRDRLSTGNYIVTGDMVEHKKGEYKGDPDYSKGFDEGKLQISKLPTSNKRDNIFRAINTDFDPAFLEPMLHMIFLYGLLYSYLN